MIVKAQVGLETMSSITELTFFVRSSVAEYCIFVQYFLSTELRIRRINLGINE